MGSGGTVVIQVGILGFGFMGKTHFKNWSQQDEVKVVAVCDSSPVLTLEMEGNIEVQGNPIDLSQTTIYRDLDDMLSAEDLDVVSVTLPSHLHCEATKKLLDAGAHVVCEKPMALTVPECNQMIAAAKESGKQLLVAHCIRYWPAYRWLREQYLAGKFGELLSAEFDRLSAMPKWSGESWMADSSKSGGIALDLHIHDIDFILHLLGEPDGIESKKVDHGCLKPGHIATRLEYAGKCVSASASWLMPDSFGFEMRYEVIFEKATVVFSSKGNPQVIVYPNGGDAYSPEGLHGDGYEGEIRGFTDFLNGKPDDLLITAEQAKTSVEWAWKSIQ